jgi:ankyrin repeat protein
MTPLNIALRKVDYRLLNLLLTSPKIDLNRLDSAGFSPLNIAIMSNNLTQVSILLDYGATIIDPKTTIYNIDLKNCKNIIPSIKNLMADYSEGVKIARTPYQRYAEKQLIYYFNKKS